MSGYEHSLRLTHSRGRGTQAEVSASCADLTEAWTEVLSRLPNDVYAALKVAMQGAVASGDSNYQSETP